MSNAMTRPEYKNVLVTAWNDSGAGRFMRLMDGADQVFAFPFELLLGAEAAVGIQNEASLVSGKYRWNVFRDPEQFQAVLEQEPLNQRALDPSESELNDWLAARKFDALSQYKDRARSFVDSLAVQTPDHRQLLQTDAVLAYIESMKAVFAGHHASINLIHSPCAALDWERPQFWSVFSRAIVIVIDPRWGFGNMHARNKIPPHRYLERWLRINQASLQLKQQHPEHVLILRSSADATQQAENIARAHDFLGISTMNATTRTPTLLGEAMGDIGFPFGGIMSWSAQSHKNSIAEANEALAKADNHAVQLLDQCVSLYKLLEP